jgi:hypothetical protein
MYTNSKNKKWFGILVVIFCCLLLAGPVKGGTAWLERQKLLASDGAAYDRFGLTVSISGDYAIVGAYNDDDMGTDSGSAYIFKRDGTNWVQQQKFNVSDGAAGDHLGRSISINGDYAIVGAFFGDGNELDSGSAYMFKRDGDNWVQQQKLTADDGAGWDFFGFSSSISGDYVIIGVYGDDDNGSQSGSAYIFKRDGTTWSQQQKLLVPDGVAWDDFGISVSISGDYAIIGARRDDDRGYNSGSAYIFNRDGESWNQQAKLTAADGTVGDYFGCFVSISGDYAVVGAEYGDGNEPNSGSAYIFNRNGTSWVQQQKLTDSDGAAEDYFGWSVSISGDKTIVGAALDDGNEPDSGSAYIFRRDGESWVQQQKLTAADGADGDLFGHYVSISGDLAIVGAFYGDGNVADSGSAYIFQAVECADWLTADLNSDCFVDFTDFSIFANQWLKCGDPCDPNCQL